MIVSQIKYAAIAVVSSSTDDYLKETLKCAIQGQSKAEQATLGGPAVFTLT